MNQDQDLKEKQLVADIISAAGITNDHMLQLTYTNAPHWLKESWRFNTEDELKIAEIAINRIDEQGYKIRPWRFYKQFVNVLKEMNIKYSYWYNDTIKEVVEKEDQDFLFKYMNNFDDPDCTNEEWEKKLKQSVVRFNMTYHSFYDPNKSFNTWYKNGTGKDY